MQDLLPGRTGWETEQYRKDHGAGAAIAVGLQLLARHVMTSGALDAAALGLGELPPPRPYMLQVTGGTGEERRAKIDRYAARHGITAAHDDTTGTYRAVLSFGPVSCIAWTAAEGRLTQRVKAIHREVAAMAGRSAA